MGYVPIEKLLDKSGYSVYKLVILSSKRALEIAEGQPKMVNVDASMKPSTIALYEIAAGFVTAKKLKVS
jgi:DNA-directed RNA polymerase omega subunit